MLAFEKFPDLIPTHGPECLSFLVGKCKKSLVDGSSPGKHKIRNIIVEPFKSHTVRKSNVFYKYEDKLSFKAIS